MEGEPVYVRVLYNFDYTAKETKLVSIRQGEKLELLKQTNSDWWQVRRDDETKPFYVPAAYVREIPPAFINPALIHAGPKGFNNKNVKIIPQNDISPKFSPSADYQNIGAPDSSPESPRNNIENTLRKELIHGNFNSSKPCDNNKNKFIDNKLQDSTRLGNLVNDIKVQQKVSPDNRGVVSFQPSSKAVETRSYSVVTPVIAKKPPVPCPRLKELSKSLETLAEEIQFTPSSQQQSDSSSWKNEETSDYHTPSPDNLENDMFGWRKSIQPKISDDPSGSSNVQRSSSFRITRWPSRKKKRERKRAEIKENDECSEEDSTVSRSLESLVDSGAEACSSSSYEWDRSGETSEGATTPKRIPEPLAFRNFTYRSSDSDEEQVPRQRSVSDTSQPDSQPLKLVNSKSESHVQDEQPRPLVSLKRNQKLVGCRRRPALLCIPSNNNNNANKKRVNSKEVYLPRAPCFPPSPAPHEKPLRVLPGGWAEFYCSDAGGTGRVYYFHAVTGDRSWKPPRTRKPGETQGDEISAPEDGSIKPSRSPSPSTRLVLPPGWEESYDEDADLPCYIHKTTGAKWFSSNDREGRLYFFEQNSNESSWTLPEESITSTPNTSPTTKTPSDTTSCGSPKDKQPPASPTKPGAAVIASLRQGVVAQKTAEAERRLAAAAAATTEDQAPSGDEDGDESPEDGTASPHIRAKLPPGALLLPAYPGLRVAKTRSMVIVDNKRGSVTTGHDESKSASMPRNWPQLLEAGMAVLKEGQLNKTKLTENGKKLRKNWAPSHVVLTELFLLFFRDAKSFAAMKSGTTGGSKPEMSIDLNGAVVETGEKFSSRKNVFVVTTALGQQVLCQEDNMGDAHSWFHQVSLAIKSLPSSGNNSVQRIKCLPSREGSPQVQPPSESPPEEKNAISRTKSVKVKKDTGSVEDLTASNSNSAEQTKIKARLKKFFVRRPTMESLVKKGIWKDEPAFGSYLAKLCFEEPGLPQVPIFVQRCIAAIECKPENMKTDGLYRASGNLSQVQKIRLQVDQNNLNVLDQEEDVHVLTGALKLFFRELKEPLIPYDAFNKALKASTNPNKKDKLQQFRDIIKNLPPPNHDTLKFLLQHLLRVTQEQASNRMHIPNLAIVFGPTLMWPEEESLNMALDLMQQNIVIESLLQEFEAIFR